MGPDLAPVLGPRPRRTAPPVLRVAALCHSLVAARGFYRDILGCAERRATRSSLQFDWFGGGLTLYEVAGYDARDHHCELADAAAPVPHFGAALDEGRFHRVAKRLTASSWRFHRKPQKRRGVRGGEEWVMVVLDPSGNAIELKSVARAG